MVLTNHLIENFSLDNMRGFFLFFCCLIFFVLQINVLLFIKLVILRDKKNDKVTKFYPFINSDIYYNQTLQNPIGNITIVTQISENRLHVLNLLANSWKGPIIAALHISKNIDVEKKVKQLRDRFSVLFKKVHMNVLVKSFGPYPMNLLRNFAIEQAWTPLIWYLDVDFIPSNNIHEKIIEFSKTKQFEEVKNNKAVLVFPTFHWNCQDNLKFETCQRGNPLFNDHPSQMTTDFRRWSDEKSIYQVEYSLLYEPYVIGSINMPKYDPTFTLGNDKTSFAYELAAMQYKFYVAPEAYIGHLPHQKDVTWALHHAEYSSLEAWHTWHLFAKRIDRMYNYRKFCDEYMRKFSASIPDCVCKEFGCLGYF